MAKITIGHENRADSATLTHSAEVAGFVAENLQAPQPSQVYRTAALAPAFVQFDLGSGSAVSKTYQLVSLVGSTFTGVRNLLRDSRQLQAANGWTHTGVGGASIKSVQPPVAGYHTVDTTLVNVSSEHLWELSVTKMSSASVTVAIGGYYQRSLGVINLQLRVGDGTNFARANFDLSDGTLEGTTTGGSGYAVVSTDTATVAIDGIDWYKCVLVATSDAAATLPLRMYALDGSFTQSWLPTAHVLKLSAVGSNLGSAWELPAETTTENAALWQVRSKHSDPTTSPDYDSGTLSASLAADLSDRSTVSTYKLLPSVESTRYVQIDVRDPNNTGSQIDIGRVFIGPIWQPQQHTFVDLQVNWSPSGKFRIWTIGLGQQITEDEIWGELHELARTVKITSSSLLTETPSGQLIAPDGAKPIVVILDPDETDNPQMLYGFVVALNAQRSAPINVSGTLTEMFSVQIEVWEAIA